MDTQNKKDAKQFAFEFIHSLSKSSKNFEEADFYSLSYEQSLNMSCLIHVDSDPSEREEALTYSDNLDLYGELMVHNPQELIKRMKMDFIEYYKEQIEDLIQDSIHDVINHIESEHHEFATQNYLDRREYFSLVSA